MKLIVGLGNPGQNYEKTRHNVGFIVVNNYVNNQKWTVQKDLHYIKTKVKNEDVIFLKPMTYMNLSGKAVLKIVQYYKIAYEDILVIHDDLALSSGHYKLKINSSSAGHNGIKNIINMLGTTSFARLKIGIGSSDKIDTKDYVLGKLSKSELENLNSSVYCNIIDYFISYGIDKTMNAYNFRGMQ